MENNNLIGKEVQTYNLEKGTILASSLVSNFSSLAKYDNSGWMDDDGDFIEEYEMDKEDILVAVELEEGDIQVYTLGGGGVELVNEEDYNLLYNPS